LKSNEAQLSKFLAERTRRRKQTVLEGEVVRWAAQVAQSLLRLENAKRRLSNLPPLTGVDVLVPRSGENGLRLLNLRTWALRYSVDLDFILSFLLHRYFAKARRKPFGNEISLGISTAALTGVAARQALEEEITHAFPSGENVRAAREDLRRHIHPIEPLGVLPQNDLVEAYGEAMQERLRQRRIKYVSKRAWRGNPDPVTAPEKD
jgi:hypothetical protein